MSSPEKTMKGEVAPKAEQYPRVRVDLAQCGGHARCMEEAPEVFGYDSKTNKAFILAGADLNAHRESVSRAVRGCPEFALRWDDGQSEGE